MRNLTVFIFVVLCVSCGSPVNDSRLVTIDSLLQQGYPDSAKYYLEDIKVTDLDKSNMAYYYLLKTIFDYKIENPTRNDSLIDISIKYYRDQDDKYHLAMSYVYKGQIESDNGNHEQAIVYLKMAEGLLSFLNSTELFVRTKVCLSNENLHSNNLHTALRYGKEALRKAEENNNLRWMAFCNNQMGVIYSHLDILDSCLYYHERAMKYCEFAPQIEQSDFYLNYGITIWNFGDRQEAERLLKKSLSLYPMAFTYASLAELYAQQGRTIEAQSLWKYALKTKDYKAKIHFTEAYATWLRQQGRDAEAWNVMKHLPAMRDSLARRQKTEAIKEIQDRYDKEWATLRLQRMLAYAVGGIVALLLLGIVVWMYLRWKAQRTKRELAEKQLLIVDYSQQIERLSKEGKENSAEMRQLEKQLDKVRSDMQSMIYNGKRLMEHVKAGGNTAVWKKKDFENVIEYYCTVNLPFVMHLEKDYRSLTPSNMFMLLLAEELKYNDAKIAECMMMSPGALRTAKSRINSRQLGQGKD